MTSCAWIFGRGASIDCGLTWQVSNWLKLFPRSWKIWWIRSAIRREIKSANTQPYKNLIKLLQSATPADGNHLFVTTNWDYLLQTEVNSLGLQVKPKWLSNSHVFHLNGSAEQWGDPLQRSKFYLESDLADQRQWSLEANKTLNKMIDAKVIVLVGISFACPMDQAFLDALSKVEDELPIGEATWLIVNPSVQETASVAEALKARRFPAGKVIAVNRKFGDWVTSGCPELATLGMLEPAAK